MLHKLATIALLTAALGAAPQRPSPATVAELIAGYTEWIQQGAGKPIDLFAIDLDVARQELARFDPAAIPVSATLSRAEAREQQRRLLTSFALELAAVGSRKHAAAAARLIEWACPYVRAHSPQNAFDRAWQLAALAALEGGIDSTTLQAHLDHVQGTFGSEPRVVLARAIADEQFGAPAEVLTRSIAAADLARAREALARAEGERYRASERAIARFREAAKIDAIAAEATLRMGHVQYRAGRYDTALETWAGLERRTSDPALVFLLHLFRGLAYEGYDRIGPARESYIAALRVSPGAHSATMRLAALAFIHGRGDDPHPLVDALLRNDDPRRDPWWSYYAADWRFWYPRIEHVRTFLVKS
jgi:tetratricopeptide (TPR) repeat protein